MGSISARQFIERFVGINRKGIILTMAVLLILMFAFLVRMNTFWLPHWRGDQNQYLSLAMKIDELGFKVYNLRGIAVNQVYLDENRTISLVCPVLMEDINAKGAILSSLEKTNVFYYDQPLFHKPPGLCCALIISHKIFAKKNQPYSVVLTNLGPLVRTIKPRIFLDAQFYAAIVPLFFSIGLVLCTFFLGKILFSGRVGLYAALLMVINPEDILISHKILNDDMVSFFVALSLVLFIIAYNKKFPWLIFLAGIICGVGVITKQSAGFMLFGIWAFSALAAVSRQGNIFNAGNIVKSGINAVFNKDSLLFGAGILIISGFWFFKVYDTFGNPLYSPNQARLAQTDTTGWFGMLAARPIGLILYPIGMSFLCPLLALAFLSLQDFAVNIRNIFSRKAYNYSYILLWAIILIFYIILYDLREQRYMLPAHPLISVLAAVYISKFKMYSGKFSKWLGSPLVRESIIFAAFVLCGLWSVPFGVNAAIQNQVIIPAPF